MTDAEQQELEQYRRQDLLRRMRDISQEQWASRWHAELEHDLYLMTFHGVSANYGMGAIAATELAELKRLAELTKTWWAWNEAARQPEVIALDEAERRYSQLIAEDERGNVHRMSVPEAKQVYDKAAANDWVAETIQPVLRGMPAWHVYRLRSNSLFALYFREGEDDWELRFGDTTLAIVQPAWAKKN